MNQAQQKLLDEVGLGALLAIAWCVGVLILLIIRPTPPMLIVGATAATIGFLFAMGVGSRWLYLGQRAAAAGSAEARRKGNRVRFPR